MKALLAAAVVGTSVLAMAGTVSAATYVPQKTVVYWEYKGKWTKTSEETVSYNKSGAVTKSTTKEYDMTNGKLERTKSVSNTYKRGKLVSSKSYENGKLKSQTTYTYKGSKLVKDTRVENKEKYVTTYTYKSGRIAKISTKLNKTVYSTTTTYTYDKKGRLTKSKIRDTFLGDNDRICSRDEIVAYSNFDSHGNARKETCNFVGYTSSKTTHKYTYNKNGVMTQKVTTSKLGSNTNKFKTVYSKFKKIS